MTQDILAFDHLRQLDKLKEAVGGFDECKRLGFIHVDEQEVQRLSAAGMGYLSICPRRAEAFAAGRLAAFEEIEDQKEKV